VPDPTSTVAVVVRGPLKYAVDTSSPQVEAGKRFSVSVRITNPYDVPVIVRNVVMKLPAKFVEPSTVGKKTARQTVREVIEARSLWPLVGPAGGEFVQAAAPAGGEEHIELQPGNSTVRVFAIKTVNTVFFAPSLYNLNIEVEYDIDEKVNHDTVAYQMNVRAPLMAIILGSVAGSAIGYIVKVGVDPDMVLKLPTASTARANDVRFLFGLLTAVLLASIVVVAFARKKDAQPILSIEDFWGGLFVGFLSAYGGDALLKQIGVGAP
jgi:hypothetical protein